MSKNEVYIVIANRVFSTHSYVVGIYDKKHAAQVAVDKEDDYRGGKYECAIDEWIINEDIAGKNVHDYPKRIPKK